MWSYVGHSTTIVSSGQRRRAEPAGTSQIEPENSDAREIDRLKAKNVKQENRIELLNKRVAELINREEDLMERLDRMQEVANGKIAGGEKVMERMGAEIIQLKNRLKKRTSKLFRVEKDAKERNDRNEISIKRLEATVADLRRRNEDANREDSRNTWSIRKPEEKVTELNQQAQGTTTIAEMRRLLQERTAELSILEAENQRNASKAQKSDGLEAKIVALNRDLQDKNARLSDLEGQSQRSAWRGGGTEQSDTTAVDLDQQLQEMAKVSEMEEAARRKEEEVRVLEAKVAELSRHVQGETEASQRKGKGVEQSDEVVTKLNQRLQEEMAKTFTMEEAARRKEKETKGLEEKVAELRQRLRGDTEASRRRERDIEQLEAQKAETERRLHEKTVNLEEVVLRNSRKGKDTERLEARMGELEQRLQEKTAKLSNMEEVARRNSRKDKDTERLEARVGELEQRLQEKILKLSNMEEVARQNSRKETESKRLETKVSELELRLQEKTTKLSNTEKAFRKNPRNGENSEWPEAKVARLRYYLQESTAKLSSLEDDTRCWEQKNRDLSATNQKQRDEINQLKALVNTVGEQASTPASHALVSKEDSVFAAEVADLVRILNAQIEQVSTLIADSLSNQESPSFGEASGAALNELWDYLGPWLFNDLRRRSNKPETEYEPLITQIALQTVLIRICNRVINHWNPLFLNDGSISFRVDNNTGGVGHVIAGTWSALAPSYMTMSPSEIQEANVKYLSEMLVKLITAAGGSLQKGGTLPSEYQEKVEDISKRALDLHQIVCKDGASMDVATYIVPFNAQFDPSQMDDTEGCANKTGSVPQDRVICTLEMGLRYRKRTELREKGGYGEECGVTLKPKVVLSATLKA